MPLQKRVDQLPSVTGIAGPDLLILSRTTGATGTIGTRRVSVDQIATYFQAAGVAGPTGPAGSQGPSVTGPTGATGIGITGPAGPAGVGAYDQSLNTTDSVTFAGCNATNGQFVELTAGDPEDAGGSTFYIYSNVIFDTGITVSGIPADAIDSGTIDIARIPTGTTSTTVALGNHTHTQLHDRSHAITSTSDHTAGNWKVLYSNGSGQVIELSLGAQGTVLQSGGASAAPSFGTVQKTITYGTAAPTGGVDGDIYLQHQA